MIARRESILRRVDNQLFQFATLGPSLTLLLSMVDCILKLSFVLLLELKIDKICFFLSEFLELASRCMTWVDGCALT